jgi:hypothetical protein
MISMGMAAASGHVYLFDRLSTRIIVMDSAGRRRGTFSRAGRGPGEILPPGAMGRVLPKGRRADWINATDGGVVVFDGLTVHNYDASGKHLHDVLSLAGASLGSPPLFSSRMRSWDSRTVIDVESLEQSLDGPTRTFRRSLNLWLVSPDEARIVYSTRLVSFPVRGVQHAPHSGVNEASPLWDIYGGCLVISDGGSPFVVLANIRTAAVDTVTVRLPDRVPADGGESAKLLAKIGQGGDPPPPPALLRRVQRMIVDPDGWLWIEPIQPPDLGSQVEVWRTDIESGAMKVDTVPVFPSTFLRDGGYWGIRVSRGGTVVPHRVWR